MDDWNVGAGEGERFANGATGFGGIGESGIGGGTGAGDVGFGGVERSAIVYFFIVKFILP